MIDEADNDGDGLVDRTDFWKVRFLFFWKRFLNYTYDS